MTTITTHTFNVLLEPHQLDQHYHNHILLNLKRKLEHTCSYELGYILQVIDTHCDTPGVISKTNGFVRFHVNATMKILKPEKGQVHDATIETVIDYGVICLIYGIMRCCVLTDQKNFEINQVIPIRITAFRFENEQFSCVGEIV